MNNRMRWIGISVLAVSLVLAGVYFAYNKFLRDQLNAAALLQPNTRTMMERMDSTGGRREVKTYTAEDLEKARKEGKLPPGAAPYTPPATTAASDAAIQRTLKTLEEINRINEMNQRLMDQQQRQQKQQR